MPRLSPIKSQIVPVVKFCQETSSATVFVVHQRQGAAWRSCQVNLCGTGGYRAVIDIRALPTLWVAD